MSSKKLTLKRPAALGSIEWVDTHWQDVQIGVVHMDAVTVRGWSSRAMSIHYDESKRLHVLRKEFGESAPPSTEEGRAAFFELYDETLEAVAGLRGVEGLAETDAEGARELLRGASYGEAQAVMSAVLEVQQVSKFRVAAPENDGGVGA